MDLRPAPRLESHWEHPHAAQRSAAPSFRRPSDWPHAIRSSCFSRVHPFLGRGGAACIPSGAFPNAAPAGWGGAGKDEAGDDETGSSVTSMTPRKTRQGRGWRKPPPCRRAAATRSLYEPRAEAQSKCGRDWLLLGSALIGLRVAPRRSTAPRARWPTHRTELGANANMVKDE